MFKEIVVGTDGSSGANVAVDRAVELAALAGAALHVVTAYKVTTGFQIAAATEVGVPMIDVTESNEAIEVQARRICDAAVEKAGRAGVRSVAHCIAGDAAETLLQVAQEAQCDLLVVGNRGMTGVRRFMLGSVPNKLSHHSPASLLIVDTSEARA
jgi:nucleotide-binding universal stress UspA family protein